MCIVCILFFSFLFASFNLLLPLNCSDIFYVLFGSLRVTWIIPNLKEKNNNQTENRKGTLYNKIKRLIFSLSQIGRNDELSIGLSLLT